MKNLILLLILLSSIQLEAQIIFEENFDTLSVGLDLTSEGYQLSQGSDYFGTVTAVVAESNENKFAQMVASPNGGAKMQIVKTIDVEPNTIYKYEVDSKGPFKRQLRVYDEGDELVASSDDYKPSTDQEQTEWKKLEVTFLTSRA